MEPPPPKQLLIIAKIRAAVIRSMADNLVNSASNSFNKVGSSVNLFLSVKYLENRLDSVLASFLALILSDSAALSSPVGMIKISEFVIFIVP